MPRKHLLSKNLAGQLFGNLTAIEPVRFVTRWKCRCVCGKITYATTANLTRGAHRSCGCLVQETNSALNTTHGLSYDPIYGLWANILNRCLNPNAEKFANYGQRGISICARWLNFENWYNDIGRFRPSKEFSIERINVDKGYWCGTCVECVELQRELNCCWATATEQARNKTNTTYLTFKEQTKSIYEWSEITRIPVRTIVSRIHRKWSVEEALTIAPLAHGLSRVKQAMR